MSADGAVRLGLKRAFSDGTVAVSLDPLSFLCRLAAAVPGPGFHTFRYGGILSSAARWRPLVVPEPEPSEAGRAPTPSAADGDGARKARSSWRPWRELLKRSFDIDIQCSKCGGSMQLKALLTRPQSLRRLLTALGQPTDAPPRAPPRPPPYVTAKPQRYQQHHPGPNAQGVLKGEPA
jgi:hypothetical protein